MKAISGARILAGGVWLDHHAVIVDGAGITAIVSDHAIPKACDVDRLGGGMLIPGFIDTQVNGGGGVLFNDAPTIDGIRAIAAAHRRFGTTALLPTLISDDLDVIANAINAVDAAITAKVPGIIGIHIEGPFLNEDKHGIHDARKFRSLNDEAIALLSSLKHGKTLVTLAPELAPRGAIAKLVANGVIVAAGHSLATFEDMQRAQSESLSGVTHLFNAMSPLQSRAPGVVGAALDSSLICGIIVDGHHVHPAALRAAFRAKGPRELMLVTDSMPTVGSAATTFRIGDADIVLAEGRLTSPDGTLAGSNLDMASAVRNAIAIMAVDITTASQMASGTPAAFLGLSGSHGEIAVAHRADFVHLDDAFTALSTWIAGARYDA